MRLKILPHQGAFSILKIHSMPDPDRYCWISSLDVMALSSLAAALNVFPLSEMNLLGSPLLAVNRLRLHKNAEVVMSMTMSRWIARTTQRVYRQIQTLQEFVTSPERTWSGPAKINTSISKWGFFSHQKLRQRWRWKSSIRPSFKPSANGAFVNYHPDKRSPPYNPVMRSDLC